MKRFMHLKSLTSFLFLILLIVIILSELFASQLAYENFGGIVSGFLVLIIFLNIIPVVFFIMNYKKTAAAVVIIIGLSIIPLQIFNLNKLTKQKEESANIVNFVYTGKIVNGGFPEDLSEYKFLYPEYMGTYTYNRMRDSFGKDDFQLSFWTGTPSTSHFYNHSRGPMWLYCDD